MENFDPHSDSVDWYKLTAELAAYSSRVYWKYLRSIPTRMDACDLVQEALIRYLEGRRTFREGVGLFEGLAGVIKSIASHELQTERNRRRLEEVNQAFITGINSPVFDGERVVFRKLACEDLELEINIIMLQLGEKDPLLIRIIRLLLCDPGISPKELAESLGQPINKIYKRMAKLRGLMPVIVSKLMQSVA